MRKLDITIQAREILEEKIEEERMKLPFALTANHLSELLGISKRKVYDAIAAGDIPGAKKINQSWRIPRDTFLSWFYGEEVIDKKPFKEIRVVK
ncbi:excisionase family DNA binding protein [Halanaerobium saccharolyticum]|uniref:Excisionase family DNA binding protein n=1 Tax=Halanaerobium saccharolyticum TaxID=43595 RepID=A0A4R6LE50_9FIRM|nr:excisionase family DNA binding protein [Halanaerobium saccharolyticum]